MEELSDDPITTPPPPKKIFTVVTKRSAASSEKTTHPKILENLKISPSQAKKISTSQSSPRQSDSILMDPTKFDELVASGKAFKKDGNYYMYKT